jgi:hypothetical protein
MRLINTASDEPVEKARASFIVLETHRRILSTFCFDELRNVALAAMLRQTPSILDAFGQCFHLKDGEDPCGVPLHAEERCCVPVRAKLFMGSNEHQRKAFYEGYLACVYAHSAVNDDAGASAAEAVGRCCHRAGARRREKYFVAAGQILKEAIELGAGA